MPRRKFLDGFTLVELLVVIGIISVLISILLPALSMARESAKATTCLSNMRQLGTLLVAYMNENNGWLPIQPATSGVVLFASSSNYAGTSSAGWSCLGSLIPYFSSPTTADQVFICPTAGEVDWLGTDQPAPPSDTSYLANAAVVGHKLSRITSPADIIWLQEDRFCWDVAWLRPLALGGTPPEYSDWCFPNGSFWGQEYDNVHYTHALLGARSGGGNIAFLDGHAEYSANRSLHPSDFGLVGIPGTSTSSDPNTTPQGVPYYGAFDN